jgi:hypothetical protein
MVASPPSSTIRSGPLPSGHIRACSVHHQYSSGGFPPSRRKRPPPPSGQWPPPHDPGWKRCCRTPSECRPREALRVSISMAVWMVMCRLPVTFRPLSGCRGRIFHERPSARAFRFPPAASLCHRSRQGKIGDFIGQVTDHRRSGPSIATSTFSARAFVLLQLSLIGGPFGPLAFNNIRL